MAEFFTGGAFSMGAQIVRNVGEIRQSMQLKSQELDWRRNQAPAMQARMQEIMERAQAAADESDNAEPGSPEEQSAQGRYMVELSRAAPRVMAMLSGLQLSGNPFAAQAGQATSQSFLAMMQATMQGAATLQGHAAQAQEMKFQQEQATRQQELDAGQQELQRGAQGIQREQLAGEQDQRALQRDMAPLQREQIQADTERSRAQTEQARAEAKQVSVGRPATLAEKAQFLSALTEAETAGALTPEQGKAAREQIGLPAGIQNLESWDKELEAEKRSLEAMLQRAKDPATRRKIEKRLGEIPKEDEAIMSATVARSEKRRKGPRWYEEILNVPLDLSLGRSMAPAEAAPEETP